MKCYEIIKSVQKFLKIFGICFFSELDAEKITYQSLKNNKSGYLY